MSIRKFRSKISQIGTGCRTQIKNIRAFVAESKMAFGSRQSAIKKSAHRFLRSTQIKNIRAFVAEK